MHKIKYVSTHGPHVHYHIINVVMHVLIEDNYMATSYDVWSATTVLPDAIIDSCKLMLKHNIRMLLLDNHSVLSAC
jgi:hypothetical protein